MNRFNRYPTRQPRHRIKSFDPSFLVKNGTNGHTPATETVYSIRNSFSDFGFQNQLMNNINYRQFPKPTPIQDQVIPLLLTGKDVVGLANTGTGKTASFLLPLIQKVSQDRSQKVLIMAPTRELATQIEEELRLFSREMRIYSALCIGGVGINGQIHRLRFNPNFVIGTPGRLKDLQQQGKISFTEFNNVVLDEVDRMLDMGFIHDMTQILSALPVRRQSAFFSATASPEVLRIMNRFLTQPTTISIKTNTVLTNITQEVVKTNGQDKVNVLHDLLVQQGFDKVLVFGRTKWGLEKLANDLSRRGFAVASIHGNKSQGQRKRSLEEFKSNRVKVLLATDVASRGLDIDNITHVINFDLPESYDDYIHMIGRTGRANKKGKAVTLIP